MRKKHIILSLLFSFSIFSVFIVSRFIEYKISSDWDELKVEKTENVLKDIINDIDHFQLDLYEIIDDLSKNPSLISSLKKYPIEKSSNQAKIFNLIDPKDESINLEIFSPDFNTIAWSGRKIYIPKDVFNNITSDITYVTTAGSIYTYLTIIKKVHYENILLGYLVGNKVISINYPLNNRYLRSYGLEQDLEKKYNVEINLRFSKSVLDSNTSNQYLSALLKSKFGDIFGSIRINNISSYIYIEKFNDLSNKIINILIVLFIIYLSILSSKWYINVKNKPFLKILFFLLHVWIIRYIFIIIGFPDKSFNFGIFSPESYSSSFGYGLASSLGDLFITSLLLLISVVYIFKVIIHNQNRFQFIPKFSIHSKLLFLLIFCLLSFIPWIIVRSYGAIVRSAVFDSNLAYYDFSKILPTFPVSLMIITLSFLTISLLLFVILLISAQFLLLKNLSKIKLKIAVFISFFISLIVFHFIQNEPQVSLILQIIFLLFAYLLTILFYSIINENLKINYKFILTIILFASLIVYPVLHEKISFKQKDDLQNKAEEIIRPVDDNLNFLMNKALSEISIDSNLKEIIAEFSFDKNYDEAFLQWIKSPLSQEKYNSALIISKENGDILSVFSVGILDNDIKLFLKDLKNINQPIIKIYQIGTSSLKHYIGYEPIYDNNNEKIGVVGIILASDEYIFLKNDSPEFLKNYYFEEKFSDMQTITISEYLDSKIIKSTNNFLSKDLYVPKIVNDKFIKDKKINKAWIDETINEKSVKSLYISGIPDNPSKRIFSISIEEIDFRWHLFNIFKILLVNLVLIILVFTIIFTFNYFHGRRIIINFRTKILFSLLSLSLIPVLGLWFYTKNFITDENTKSIIRHLDDDIDITTNNLLKFYSGQIDSNSFKGTMSLFEARQIADNSGRDFNIYYYDSLVISSRPEIYKTELVSKYVSPMAFFNIILQGKNFYYENLSIGNFPYIVGYVPIASQNGNIIGILSIPILYKNSATDKELAQSIAFIFGAFSIVIILIIVIASYLANRISLPIKNLTKATKQIMDGDLDSHIPTYSKNEIGELISSFNMMRTKLKASQKEIVKIERELAWKEMAKQVAHEIKNPLTPMKLSVQHLQQIYLDKVENFENVFNKITKTLIEQIESLSNISSEFSNFAKMPRRSFHECKINDILQEAINLFKGEKNIDFNKNFSDNIPDISADPEELRRVFINIIRNGIQAIRQTSSKKGIIEIYSRFNGKRSVIRIIDNGIGIKENDKQRLFEPNFSTKSDGMGLGLAICKKIIEDLNAEITIESQESKGTEVKITF